MCTFGGPLWVLILSLVAAAAGQQGHEHSHDHGSSGHYNRDDDGAGWDIRLSVPGEPERDYPVLNVIPRTNFNCEDKIAGYYADEEARCQVFRVCATNAAGGFYSFLCPNGTLFNQEVLVCDWWMNVRCSGLGSGRFSTNSRLTLDPGPGMIDDIQKMISYPVQHPLPPDYPITETIMQIYNPPDDMLSMLQNPQFPVQGQEILGALNDPNNNFGSDQNLNGFSKNSYIGGMNLQTIPNSNPYETTATGSQEAQQDYFVKQSDVLSQQKEFNAQAQQAIKITKQQFTYPSAYDKQYTLTVPQAPTGPQSFIVNLPINIPAIDENQSLVALEGGEEIQRQSSIFQQENEQIQKQSAAYKSSQGVFDQNTIRQKTNEFSTIQHTKSGNLPQEAYKQSVQTISENVKGSGNVFQNQRLNNENYYQNAKIGSFNAANRFSSKFNKETAAFMQKTVPENHNGQEQNGNLNIKNAGQLHSYKSTIVDSRDHINNLRTQIAKGGNKQINYDENYDQYRITSGVSPTTITDEENQGEFYSIQQRFGKPKTKLPIQSNENENVQQKQKVFYSESQLEQKHLGEQIKSEKTFDNSDVKSSIQYDKQIQTSLPVNANYNLQNDFTRSNISQGIVSGNNVFNGYKQTSGPSISGYSVQSVQKIQSIPSQQYQSTYFEQIQSTGPQKNTKNLQNLNFENDLTKGKITSSNQYNLGFVTNPTSGEYRQDLNAQKQYSTPITNSNYNSNQDTESVDKYNSGEPTVSSKFSDETLRISLPIPSSTPQTNTFSGQQIQTQFSGVKGSNAHLEVSKMQQQIVRNQNFNQQVIKNGFGPTNEYLNPSQGQLLAGFQNNNEFESAIKQQGGGSTVSKTSLVSNQEPEQNKYEQIFSIQKQFGGSNVPSPFTKSMPQGNLPDQKSTFPSKLTSTQTTFPREYTNVQVTKIEGQQFTDQRYNTFNGNSNLQTGTGQFTGQINKGIQQNYIQPTRGTFAQNIGQQPIIQNTKSNLNEIKQSNNEQVIIPNTFQQPQSNYNLPNVNPQNTQFNQFAPNSNNFNQNRGEAHFQHQTNAKQILVPSSTLESLKQNNVIKNAFSSQEPQQLKQQPDQQSNHVRFENQQSNEEFKPGFTRVEFVPAFGFDINSANERGDYLSAVTRGLQNIENAYIPPYEERSSVFTSGGFSGLNQPINSGLYQNSRSNGFQMNNFDSRLRTTGFGGVPFTPSFTSPQFSFDNSARIQNTPSLSSQVQMVRNLHQQTHPLEEYGYPKIKPSISFTF